MLVLVVGPSGAGKDSLLNGAREAFRGDARIGFARRVITRPPDPYGENHEPVSEAGILAVPQVHSVVLVRAWAPLRRHFAFGGRGRP